MEMSPWRRTNEQTINKVKIELVNKLTKDCWLSQFPTQAFNRLLSRACLGFPLFQNVRRHLGATTQRSKRTTPYESLRDILFPAKHTRLTWWLYVQRKRRKVKVLHFSKSAASLQAKSFLQRVSNPGLRLPWVKEQCFWSRRGRLYVQAHQTDWSVGQGGGILVEHIPWQI